MEGTAKASKHVKRNGVWQDPMDQTVASEMRPQECRPLPGIPWQPEGFEGHQPGTRTIVVKPPVLNRPPPVWIRPQNAGMPMVGRLDNLLCRYNHMEMDTTYGCRNFRNYLNQPKLKSKISLEPPLKSKFLDIPLDQ